MAEAPGGTTARVVSVLDALARHHDEGLGVRELAAELGISKSVVHRILAGLAEAGVAKTSDDGRYRPGVVMASWAGFLRQERTLLAVAESTLAELVSVTREGAFVTAYEQGDHVTTIVATQDSPQELVYRVRVGLKVPLHIGGSGKSILAHLPEGFVDELPLEGFTDRTLVDAARLRQELRKVRRTGYAVSRGELAQEASGIGSAYFVDGRVAGSVCINVPTVRLQSSEVPVLGAQVCEAAARVTRLLSREL
jgi:DNA-binding IclR family transcriptional regulator